jgi:hypothetical protein
MHQASIQLSGKLVLLKVWEDGHYLIIELRYKLNLKEEDGHGSKFISNRVKKDLRANVIILLDSTLF